MILISTVTTVFFLIFICKTMLQRDLPTVQSPNHHDSQSWTSWKPGTWNFMWVSYKVDRIQALGPASAALPGSCTRSAAARTEVSTQKDAGVTGSGWAQRARKPTLRSFLHTYMKCPSSSIFNCAIIFSTTVIVGMMLSDFQGCISSIFLFLQHCVSESSWHAGRSSGHMGRTCISTLFTAAVQLPADSQQQLPGLGVILSKGPRRYSPSHSESPTAWPSQPIELWEMATHYCVELLSLGWVCCISWQSTQSFLPYSPIVSCQ